MEDASDDSLYDSVSAAYWDDECDAVFWGGGGACRARASYSLYLIGSWLRGLGVICVVWMLLALLVGW